MLCHRVLFYQEKLLEYKSMGRKFISFLIYTGVFLISMFLFALITFAIAIRGGKIYVPKFTGMKIEQAQKVAEKSGIVLRVVARRQEEGIDPGIILSQEPYPGSEIKKGGEVRVAISEGGEKIRIPDFRGKKVEEVRLETEDLGIAIGNITRIYYPGLTSPSIIAQSPAPGQEVPKGGYVDLLVGLPLREAYVMPDFIGRNFELVQIKLTAAGFKVAPAEYVEYPGWEAGVIVQQLPFPGYKISRDQEISFKVTR